MQVSGQKMGDVEIIVLKITVSLANYQSGWIRSILDKGCLV